MTTPSFNRIANHPLLVGTDIARVFLQEPLAFIDVGARRGAPPLAAPLAGLTSFLGFEPDAEECRHMNEDADFKAPWAACEVLPVALGKVEEDVDLHLTELSTNISLYRPNKDFGERYRPRGMNVVGVERVRTQTLDGLVQAKGDARWGEFIKLDTQGSELDILRGAEAVLASQTLCVVAEVEFCELYENQPRFSEVEQYLRGLGFSFYGFHTMNFRSQKRLNKAIEAGRERLLWADAVFFKDPFDRGGKRALLESRAGMALFLIAIVLEYYDLALELAENLPGGDKEKLAWLVQDLAKLNPQETVRDVSRLLGKLEERPERAHLMVSRFVDSRRHLNDVQDIPDITN